MDEPFDFDFGLRLFRLFMVGGAFDDIIEGLPRREDPPSQPHRDAVDGELVIEFEEDPPVASKDPQKGSRRAPNPKEAEDGR